MIREKLFGLNPTQIIVLGFFIIILLGSVLLTLPFSSTDGNSVPFIDAFFTATSAVCVTGLVVENTFLQWSFFGKCVIMCLIQIGGLGFMTILSSIFVLLGRKITFKERVLIQESLNLSSAQGIVVFVKRIVKGTLFIEGIFSILFLFVFIPEFGVLEGIFISIFHSISSFCNAGFDIFATNSLIGYKTNSYLLFLTAFLIILGGLGFTVWSDLLKVIKTKAKHTDNKGIIYEKINTLSLHSKLALSITFLLIVSGTLLFLLMEFNNPNTIGNLKLWDKLVNSFFQSTTLRTAGFDSVNQYELVYGSKFLSILLMAIGGSPGGTAGGIKTVTLGVVIVAVISVVKGSDSINIFKKSISLQTLQKALAVFAMLLSIVIVSTIILTISEKNLIHNFEFIDYLFEVVSATGTVGLTTGITPYLSLIGKLIICMCMFFGRLGPITVAFALTSKQKQNKNLIHYPEDKIIVG